MNDIFTDFFSGGFTTSRGYNLNVARHMSLDKLNVRQANERADRATIEVQEMAGQLERLRLVTQGMWELLREHSDLTEADLESKILEIDLRDGTQDGKMGAQVALCDSCHRKTGVKAHRRCIYCGTQLTSEHIVEG